MSNQVIDQQNICYLITGKFNHSETTPSTWKRKIVFTLIFKVKKFILGSGFLFKIWNFFIHRIGLFCIHMRFIFRPSYHFFLQDEILREIITVLLHFLFYFKTQWKIMYRISGAIFFGFFYYRFYLSIII